MSEQKNWLETPEAHGLQRREWIGILIALASFAVVWLLSLSTYTDQPANISPASITASQSLQVTVRANNFNNTSENLRLQLTFQGLGDLVDSRGLLRSDIAIRVTNNQSVQVLRFLADDPLSSKEIALQVDGDPNRYPFDNYTGAFTLSADKKSAQGGYEPLAITVGTKRAETGWFTKYQVTPNTVDETTVSIVTMKREKFHVSFAVMLATLLLLLSLITIVVGFLCITNRRKSEPSVISWLGGLLIAMPFARRMMPGDPPLGCLLDVGMFSWALLLGIIAIGLAMIAWLRQSRAALTKK